MRQTELKLSARDRSIVEEVRSKGVHRAREVNRAHVLWCLDRDVPEVQIMAMLGVGRTALWRARTAYLQGGLDLVLFDIARPGRPREYDTTVEAQVSALACSTLPAGHKRWTVAELEQVPIIDGFQDDGFNLNEQALRHETRKILGAPWLRLSATCIRAPFPVAAALLCTFRPRGR